ncbi:phosphatase PAP2 family protein [Cellulomonas persica]|uniref:Inositol phosphorylceramide synthase n=1 Tax=Cellulomonas persica TaxID=76861 RepID=A0A510UUP7_9CELL|nr:phosphatase PAP2 family protein [Cellulomonas persica]GEK18368.1 inositol phosphorylceramide synthase [Cellulomonas persica]
MAEQTARRDETRTPAHRWRRLAIEVLLLLVGAVLFFRVHHLVGTDLARATQNAEHLMSLERAVGLDIELGANRWLAGQPVLVAASVLYYRLYYVPLAGVLVWLLLPRADTYRVLRVTILVVAVLALLCYWLLPMSPPRFAMPGIVDIVAENDPVAGEGTRDLASGENHFSAFPSMHVGWSSVAAYLVWFTLRREHPRAAWLAWLFPAGMVVVVIVTGNHYVLEVVGTAVVLTLALVVTRPWARTTSTADARDGGRRADGAAAR